MHLITMKSPIKVVFIYAIPCLLYISPMNGCNGISQDIPESLYFNLIIVPVIMMQGARISISGNYAEAD
jgi:hypothetical protein